MKYLNILVASALLIFVVLGCSRFNELKKQAEADKETQTITSNDNKSQLTVPGSWDKALNVNNDASLQTGNLIKGQYAIVITESKEELKGIVTLKDFADIVKKTAKENVLLQGMETGETRSLTINGYPAMQFEANGTAAGVKLNWIYTMIDGPKNYHQVLTWSLANKYVENKPVLLDVANSFKEIDGGSAPPPAPSNKKK